MAALSSQYSKRLEGKVAIITGGASGIGESTVRLFVRHGAKVVIADIQDVLGIALCIPGKLGLSVVRVENDDFKKVLVVNVYGAYLGAKHAARVMIPAKRGVILFTSSITALVSGEASHAYTASKHAIIGLTKNLCVDLGKHGIRVNCISPSTVATPLLKSTLGLEKSAVEALVCESANLKGVVPTVEDVAEAALFLASDESKFVSGHNLVVDGGYSTTRGSFNMRRSKM